MTNIQLKILVFLPYYYPGHKAGGAVRTIANMVEGLGDEIEFKIITSDRDLGDATPYSTVDVDRWNRVGKALVNYTSPGRRGLSIWRNLVQIDHYDVLYLNSLFHPVFSLLPLQARRWSRVGKRKPVIVAPRGQFGPGALKIKRFQKTTYLRLTKAMGLYSDVLWHASSCDEQFHLSSIFRDSPQIHVARDLPECPPAFERLSVNRGRDDILRVVFISRICRMKNLDFALRILAQSPLPIEFDIWGPLEDSLYWNKCLMLIEALPSNIVARYRGVLDHKHVMPTIAGYDLLFLPTQGENYGHVIAEALSAGTAVLISNETPWHDLTEDGVGWDIALTNEAGFLNALNSAFDRLQKDSLAWRRKIHEYAVNRLRDPNLLEANRQLFYRAAGRSLPFS
ncbi:glycosyltransferase [Thiococcus pfennigii]|uniref:glycosyltransferase n=1 Tax=Thiococcus pfennigii TaxID=1057 RepID=UPI001902E116|nr:glycosyltransferase [Thiococcus pfennigii]MBK1732619.1 hypothetical protein [Thiococcus pfennigii]